jgi:putative colanic acid biosynthesis acetyltransferase WcaB
MTYIFCDWNRNFLKGRLLLAAFRLASVATRNKLLFVLFVPYLILYRVVVEWILGVELPWKTKVGRGLAIHHGYALVVNDGSVIGDNCDLRHCTTIGNKQLEDGSFSRCPVIGNSVNIGSNVCIIGPVTIGDNVKIGAGSVVVKDIPANSVAVGNPARVIKTLSGK